MIKEIISWIDKKLDDVSNDLMFKKYFENINLIKGEDTFYLTNESEGIELVISNSFIIDTVHIFSGNYMDAKAFKSDLPFNIKFSFSRSDVQEIFGKPNKTGGGHKALYIGYVPFWDKYYFDGYSLHFRYAEDNNSIDMVTIASLKLEEYFNSEMQ